MLAEGTAGPATAGHVVRVDHGARAGRGVVFCGRMSDMSSMTCCPFVLIKHSCKNADGMFLRAEISQKSEIMEI